MGKVFSALAAPAQSLEELESFRDRLREGMFYQESSNSFRQLLSTNSNGNVMGLTEAKARRRFKKALSSSSLFRNLSEELFDGLFQKATPVFVHKGQVIFREGAVGQVTFILIAGSAVATRMDSSFKGEEEMSKVRVRVGSVLGTHCVVVNSPHHWTITANETCLLMAIHRLQYQAIASSLSVRERARILKTRKHVLRSVPMFGDLTEEQMDELETVLEVRGLFPGQRLVKFEEPCLGLYIVVKGDMAYRRPKHLHNSMRFAGEENPFPWDVHEIEELKWFHQADHFGEGALLFDEHNSGVDIAVTPEYPAEVLFLSKEKFEEISNPHGYHDVVRRGHILHLLNKSPIFANLTSDQINTLYDLLETRRFEDGDPIKIEGLESKEYFCLIVAGTVLMEAPHAESLGAGDEGRHHKDSDPRSIEDIKEKTYGGLEFAEDADVSTGVSHFGFVSHIVAEEGHVDYLRSEVPSVVMLEGETVGEETLIKWNEDEDDDGVEEIPKEAIYSALGDCTLAVITVDILKRIRAFNSVRAAILEYETQNLLEEGEDTEYIAVQLDQDDSTGEVQEGGTRPDMEESDEGNKSNYFSNKFLKLGHLLEITLSDDGNYRPRRESLADTINRNNMQPVESLHSTPMTNVVLSLHQPTGQIVVVKATNVERANDVGQGQYIYNEQALMSQFHSPFITQLLTTWEEPKTVLLALEPVVGGDMERVMRATQPRHSSKDPQGVPHGELGCLTFAHARFITACIVVGLKHLYEYGVVHRDCKPANLIMDHHGYIKLADFGISKQLPYGSNRTFTLAGTPKYMSPEHVSVFSMNSEGYGFGTDWWSLGVMMIEFAVYAHPFVGQDRRNIADTFDMILAYAARNGDTSLEERKQDEVFKVITEHDNYDPATWGVYVDLAASFLNPSVNHRAGADLSGPRRVLSHPLFGDFGQDAPSIEWKSFHKRRFLPPYRPREEDFIVNLNRLREMVEANDGGKATRPGMFHHENDHADQEVDRSSLESKVRQNLEHDQEGFMGETLKKTQRNRRRMMIDQHRKSKVFELKAIENHSVKAAMLRRAAVAEAMHHLVVEGARKVFHEAHHRAAVMIQRIYRGRIDRKKFEEEKLEAAKRLRAIVLIQIAVKRWIKKKRERERLEAEGKADEEEQNGDQDNDDADEEGGDGDELE